MKFDAKPHLEHRPLTSDAYEREVERIRTHRRSTRRRRVTAFVAVVCVMTTWLGAEWTGLLGPGSMFVLYALVFLAIPAYTTGIWTRLPMFASLSNADADYNEELIQDLNDQDLDLLLKLANREEEVAMAWRSWVQAGLTLRVRDVLAIERFADRLKQWRTDVDRQVQVSAMLSADPA